MSSFISKFKLFLDKLNLKFFIVGSDDNVKCVIELTKEQVEFLDKVVKGRYVVVDGKVDVYGGVNMVNMNLTEIPVKFGRVRMQLDSEGGWGGYFTCSDNNLTTLKNCPDKTDSMFFYKGNLLSDYFKNIKEEDFSNWDKLNWFDTLREYPFLINIGKKYVTDLKMYLDIFPQTKLYLE